MKRRNVGKTGGEKLFEYILPLFLLQYAKSQGDQPRAKIGQGSTRDWPKYPEQNQYRLKNGDQDHYRSKIAHESDCESAKVQFSSSYRRSILRFGTHPRKFSLLQFFVSLVLVQFFVSFSSVVVGSSSDQSSPVSTLLTIIRNYPKL